MYKQTTHHADGITVRTREIDDQKLIEMLVQLHFLKTSGEDITFSTNACFDNGWSWDTLRVERRLDRGLVVTLFEKLRK